MWGPLVLSLEGAAMLHCIGGSPTDAVCDFKMHVARLDDDNVSATTLTMLHQKHTRTRRAMSLRGVSGVSVELEDEGSVWMLRTSDEGSTRVRLRRGSWRLDSQRKNTARSEFLCSDWSIPASSRRAFARQRTFMLHRRRRVRSYVPSS
jgi:hypothetical protein